VPRRFFERKSSTSSEKKKKRRRRIRTYSLLPLKGFQRPIQKKPITDNQQRATTDDE